MHSWGVWRCHPCAAPELLGSRPSVFTNVKDVDRCQDVSVCIPKCQDVCQDVNKCQDVHKCQDVFTNLTSVCVYVGMCVCEWDVYALLCSHPSIWRDSLTYVTWHGWWICLTYVAWRMSHSSTRTYLLQHISMRCCIHICWSTYAALRCTDMSHWDALICGHMMQDITHDIWHMTYDARYHTCHMTYDARYHTCHIHRVAMPHSYEWYVSFVVCVSQHASILVRLQRDTRVCLFFYASMFVSVSCMRVVRVYGSMHVCVYACTGNHTMKESRHIYTHIEHT